MSIGLTSLAKALEPLGAKSLIVDEGLGLLANELVVLPGQDMRDLGPERLYLLGEDALRSLPSDAAGLNLLVCTKDVTGSVGRLAGMGSNVIVLPDDISLPSTVNITNEYFQAMHRLTTRSSQIILGAPPRGSLGTLLNVLSDVLGNPISLFDANGTLVGCSDRVETGDELWDRLVYEGKSLDDLADIPMGSNDFDLGVMLDGLVEPSLYEYGSWKRRYMMGVWVEGSCRYSLIVLENNRRFGPFDDMLMEFAGEVLQQVLEADDGIQDSPSLLFATVVRSETMSPELLAKANGLGIDARGAKRVVVLGAASGKPSFLEAMKAIDSLRREPGVIQAYTMPDSRIAFVVREGSDWAVWDMSGGWRGGASYPFVGLADLGQAYRQAVAALEVSLGMDGSGEVLAYEKAMPRICAAEVAAADGSSWRCHPIAWEMVDYDERYGTEYAFTTLVYLGTFQRMPVVAKELSIHRNTVSYRLNKAEELFGFSYDDLPLMRCMLLSLQIIDSQRGLPRQVMMGK